MKTRYFKIITALLFCLMMGTSHAQTGERWYYNLNDQNIAIDGYDLVAYHTKNKAEKGKEQIKSSYKGINYWFSSAKNKKMFEKQPEQYLPAYGGWCTFFMGIDQAAVQFPPTRMTSDPTNFKVIDGQLYLFRKTPVRNFKELFEAGDQQAILKRADAFWQSRIELANKADGRPEGLNPMARMENLDWEPFMGKWTAEAYWWADTTGAVKSRFKGNWEFRYGYDGHHVEDYFTITPGLPYAGTQDGPAIRGYDVQNQQWTMTYLPVNQPGSNIWNMTGKFLRHGYLEGGLETKGPYGQPILQKIIFRLIDENNLEWEAQWSWDKGKTWKEKTGFVKATRVIE